MALISAYRLRDFIPGTLFYDSNTMGNAVSTAVEVSISSAVLSAQQNCGFTSSYFEDITPEISADFGIEICAFQQRSGNKASTSTTSTGLTKILDLSSVEGLYFTGRCGGVAEIFNLFDKDEKIVGYYGNKIDEGCMKNTEVFFLNRFKLDKENIIRLAHETDKQDKTTAVKIRIGSHERWMKFEKEYKIDLKTEDYIKEKYIQKTDINNPIYVTKKSYENFVDSQCLYSNGGRIQTMQNYTTTTPIYISSFDAISYSAISKHISETSTGIATRAFYNSQGYALSIDGLVNSDISTDIERLFNNISATQEDIVKAMPEVEYVRFCSYDSYPSVDIYNKTNYDIAENINKFNQIDEQLSSVDDKISSFEILSSEFVDVTEEISDNFDISSGWYQNSAGDLVAANPSWISKIVPISSVQDIYFTCITNSGIYAINLFNDQGKCVGRGGYCSEGETVKNIKSFYLNRFKLNKENLMNITYSNSGYSKNDAVSVRICSRRPFLLEKEIKHRISSEKYVNATCIDKNSIIDLKQLVPHVYSEGTYTTSCILGSYEASINTKNTIPNISSYVTTDFIPISSFDVITYTATSKTSDINYKMATRAFYSEKTGSYNHLSTDGFVKEHITTGEEDHFTDISASREDILKNFPSAKYMRFCSYGGLNSLKITYYTKEIVNTQSDISIVQDDISMGHFEDCNCSLNGYLNINGSVVQPTEETYKHSEFIPVDNNLIVFYTGSGRLNGYNDVVTIDQVEGRCLGHVLTRANYSNRKITGKEILDSFPTAKYIRFSTLDNTKDEYKLQVKKYVKEPINDNVLENRNKILELSNDITDLSNNIIGNILYKKTYLACGDSYTQGDFSNSPLSDINNSEAYDKELQQWKTYPYLIGKRNVMTWYNVARCGGTMHCDKQDPRNYNKNHFVDRLEELSTEISSADYITFLYGKNEDFGVTTLRSLYNATTTDCLSDRLENYSISYLSNYASVHISSLNDSRYDSVYISAENYGDKNSSTKDTIWGSWNITLSNILSVNPDVKLGIMLCDGGMAREQRDVQLSIADYWGIPVLDLTKDKQNLPNGDFRYNGMNPFAKSQRQKAFQVSEANSHPGLTGHYYRSTIIENFMRSL